MQVLYKIKCYSIVWKKERIRLRMREREREREREMSYEKDIYLDGICSWDWLKNFYLGIWWKF